MAFDVIMPQMGESIAEATVLKWHRKVGEAIGKDETLYEISTDKVDAEIPSPIAGTLLEILVDVNITVPVGSVVARLGDASGQGRRRGGACLRAAAGRSQARRAGPPHGRRGRQQPGGSPADEILPPRPGDGQAARRGPGLVPGSGQNGRVTKEDMEAYLAKRGTGPGPGLRGAGEMPTMAPAHDPSAPTLGAVPELAVPPAPHVPAFASGERVKVEPMSRMRRSSRTT